MYIEVKFVNNKLNLVKGGKLVDVGVPFVIIYNIKLKKDSADYEKARMPFVSGGGY